MKTYVDPTEQLVTEIVVRDIKRSTAFYLRLGFSLLRDGGDFVELTFEDHRLFLAEASASTGRSGQPLLRTFRPRTSVMVLKWTTIGSWREDSARRRSVPIDTTGLRDFRCRSRRPVRDSPGEP